MTSPIEKERQEAQKYLDDKRDAEYRRRLGQFATPYNMAKEIADYSFLLLKGKKIRFLEPAIGTGSFLSALLATERHQNIECALGFEIDEEIAETAKNLWSGIARIINADFTKTKLNENPANLLISNPPYVRHHYISSDDKAWLHNRVQELHNINMSGLAGLYCYFMLLAHPWLDAGAISAWLVPSEFMDVNYGAAVKEYLLDKVHLLRIHRYDPASSMFDDALVSSAVVWFSNEKVPEDYPVEFTYGGTVEEPALAKTVWRTELRKERKWTRFPEHEVRQQGLRQTKIKDAFIVKRGIATGDNSFFILDKKRIEAFGLRRDYLVPILPSPRHLDATEIFANECGDPIVENPLYLINCDLPERQIETMYPELLDYLKTGNDTVANRYLCKTKKHWYQQEQRESAPILCTYMGRGNRIDRAPFRFILNHSRAIATNSYLMLYPRDEYKTALQRNPQLLKGLWQTLNDLPSDFLTTEGRVYGGGLKKIEPKELGEVVCSSDLTQAQTTMNLALA